MALRINTEYRGLQVANAYTTVCQPAISPNKTQVEFCVVYRASPEYDQFTSVMLQGPYDINGENPYVQAYAYLKTLPEFACAEDC
ncbi:hypothetical protein D3C76_1538940 [compost metagenome]